MTNIVLSFDDGRADNIEIVRDILVPNKIPATFNITTGYVDGSCPVKMLPSEKPALTIEEVKEIGSNPLFEIALHGNNHLNSIDDIFAGEEKLIEWLRLPTNSIFGLASPDSGLSPEMFKSDLYKELRDSIEYMRVSFRIVSCKWYRDLCRKAARVLHLPMLYKVAYKETLMDSFCDQLLYSVPVMKDITLNEVKALVNHAIKNEKSIILMFHSIKEDVSQEDNWTWSTEKFSSLCHYLSQKRDENTLNICTSMELIGYLSNNG